MSRSAFVFGHQGMPSLTRTVCTRFPSCRKEPVKSWFKDIREFPYGGWGFYARLHCSTYIMLAPVFNYHSFEVAEDNLSSAFATVGTRIKVSLSLKPGRPDKRFENLHRSVSFQTVAPSGILPEDEISVHS